MSCWHGRHDWHGCGPSYGPAVREGWYGPPPDWYGPPPDWYDEAGWPARGRDRRVRRYERDTTPQELEATLGELREQVGRVEAELARLRGSGAPGEAP